MTMSSVFSRPLREWTPAAKCNRNGGHQARWSGGNMGAVRGNLTQSGEFTQVSGELSGELGILLYGMI